MNTRAAYAIAAVSGVVLWLGTSELTGRREAWHAAQYWLFAYPLGAVAAGGLAFGLLPLGLVMFTLLAVLPATAATLASAVATNRRKPSGS